jgi:protoheme ferro-lyase
LYPYEEPHLDELRQWFNTHLEKPTRFTAAKPPHYRKRSKAISWFKDSAHEHIARVREIVAILENHGVPVRMIKADRVGYIVYEDEHQIVAEPFSDFLG